MIKAVFFDLDGTLLDTKDFHFQALNQALKEETGKTITRSWFDSAEGLSTKDKLEQLIKKGLLDKDKFDKVHDKKQEYSYKLIKQNFKHNQAHEIMLSKLKQMGYKTALCSNASQGMVDLYLKMSGFGKYFDLVTTRDDVKHGKPHPDEYSLTCKKLGVKPKEALTFEDSKVGVQAAIDSGVNVVHITKGSKQINSVFVFEHILRANLG